MLQYDSIFNKGVELRLLAQRLVEAAAGKEEPLVQQYVAEADTLMSTIVTEVELELPRFAVDTPEPSDREQTARNMLDQLFDLRIKYKIKASIMERMSLRLGPTHEMTLEAIRVRNEAHSEMESLTWTILELMGVDS